ncbi:MAG: polyprenyl synthetase family protein [Actinobacteria bacterium]|nr:polyprenyl synthetase family protein [Actinomycetota bacterium]
MIKLPSQLRLVSDKKLLASIEARMELVEKKLLEATRHTDSMIDSMASHLARAGGKRLRPVLLLLTSELGDPTQEDILDAAVVMEITHLATLYHDDVMDQASKRRGVDSAHIVWGNNVAILTGDLLFARASNIVSGLGEEALTLQAKVFEQLVLGQLHETIGPKDGQDPLEHYLEVLRDKTGSLIALSARLGALLSGADKAYQQPLQLFGERIGVAFQLVDDLIDIESTKEQSGKVAGTDLLAGVPTLPVLLLAKYEDSESKALYQKISAGFDEAELGNVLAELRAHPVMAQARAETVRWGDWAIEAVSELPSGSVRDALIAFANAVVDRKG